jgi:hypothetical protein
LLKKTMPLKWYGWKERQLFEAGEKELELNKNNG